jgi:hypothetical protein
MKLKSFGCSFTWGSELPDESFTPNISSRLTWPGLLAKHLGCEYESFAYPGVGNLFIADRILNECSSDSESLYVINWTYIDRFDYVDPNCRVAPHGKPDDWASETPWKTCLPGNNDVYFKHYHSEYKDKVMSLSYIKLCIDTLQQKNIKFIMTFIDDLLFDQQWHVSPAITMLQEVIYPVCDTFNGTNFIKFADALGHKRTATGHLSSNAHYDCFVYARDNLLSRIM